MSLASRSTQSGMLRRKRGAPCPPAGRVGGNGTAAADRALGEAAVLQQSVVQHQRPGHRQIEREPRRNSHHVAAAPQHGWRQAGPLRAQHVGSVHRMTERRQVGGVVQQLDARPARSAAADPALRTSGKRHSGTCSGVSAVSASRPARASKPAPTMKQNAAPKACAVRSRAPTLADFDTPSTPMPK